MPVSGVGLCKSFAGVRALDSVDIQVGRGDIHALLGANGSGKSTLVKVLTGVHQPDRGEISVGPAHGLPAIVSPHQAGQLGVAVVHQEAPLIDTMTIAECIALFRGYPARGGRVLWGRLHAETAEMLARFGVRVDPRMLAGKLSPAERALVALVIALDRVKTGLELLILDEVTASLQEDQARSFLDRVSAIAAAGTPVLMVTHRLAELHGRATQVTVLRDGKVVHAAPAGEADDHALIGHMVGRRAVPVAGAAGTTSGGSVRRLWGTSAPAGAAPALREVVLDVAHLAGRFMEDVNFTVRRGEIVGVAGLVESGIAELPQMLGGLAPRRAGSITIGGHALSARPTPREAIGAGLALLPVDRLRSGGVATLPMTDNALLPRLGRYWHAESRERDVMARLIEGLDVRPPVPATLFGRLSGGNQQKVLLGKWLLMRPSVLVLEDPTSGVDPNARAKIFEVLRDAAREGVGILFLSTEPEQLADMCGRVLVLRDGGVAAELSGDSLDQETISRWCYA